MWWFITLPIHKHANRKATHFHRRWNGGKRYLHYIVYFRRAIPVYNGPMPGKPGMLRIVYSYTILWAHGKLLGNDGAYTIVVEGSLLSIQNDLWIIWLRYNTIIRHRRWSGIYEYVDPMPLLYCLPQPPSLVFCISSRICREVSLYCYISPHVCNRGSVVIYGTGRTPPPYPPPA